MFFQPRTELNQAINVGKGDFFVLLDKLQNSDMILTTLKDCFALDALELLFCFWVQHAVFFGDFYFSCGAWKSSRTTFSVTTATFKLKLRSRIYWVSQSTIQQFHKYAQKTVYAICRALDLKAELVPFQDYNQEPTPTIPKKTRSSNPPAVYSFTVFKVCEALELKTDLRPLNERPVFKNKKPRSVPTVRSVTVFRLCQALKLEVQLAEV
ncbi:hypothetical protein TNCT_68451 [Trichonephila clavata]|uniref:Uncharacterized protein n=1 Tax=Trichonephila clavata TaxID=2740835 RepID=A0A8X6GGR8_TRICU|nr:hypothetical protein TNCT_68451 [Trichonephila clavata]